MTAEDIAVNLRLNQNTNSKTKAWVDVTMMLGGDGVLKIQYSVVYTDKGELWVAPPAQKGTHKFFPLVHLMGPIELRVSEAVLSAYRQAIGA